MLDLSLSKVVSMFGRQMLVKFSIIFYGDLI